MECEKRKGAYMGACKEREEDMRNLTTGLYHKNIPPRKQGD